MQYLILKPDPTRVYLTDGHNMVKCFVRKGAYSKPSYISWCMPLRSSIKATDCYLSQCSPRYMSLYSAQQIFIWDRSETAPSTKLLRAHEMCISFANYDIQMLVNILVGILQQWSISRFSHFILGLLWIHIIIAGNDHIRMTNYKGQSYDDVFLFIILQAYGKHAWRYFTLVAVMIQSRYYGIGPWLAKQRLVAHAGKPTDIGLWNRFLHLVILSNAYSKFRYLKEQPSSGENDVYDEIFGNII